MVDSCLVHSDDMITIGRTFEEHLWKVFRRFLEAWLKLNPEKCQPLQKEVWYLGYIVSPEGMSTDPEMLKAL
jgi:hypothetical protein